MLVDLLKCLSYRCEELRHRISDGSSRLVPRGCGAFVGAARGMLLLIFARMSSRVLACQAPTGDKTLSGEEGEAFMCKTSVKMSGALLPSGGGLKQKGGCALD